MDERQKWLEAFEAANGRKPSPDEFIAAKNAGFDSSEFDTPADNEEITADNTENEEKVEESALTENDSQSDPSLQSTQARWANYFEELNGRKPSPQEFMAAKANDFDMSALEAEETAAVAASEPEKTAQEKWLDAFEEKNNRKPNPQEFAAAKASDFSLLTLADAPADEKADVENEAAEVPQAETEMPAAAVSGNPLADEAVEEAVSADKKEKKAKKEKKPGKKHKGLMIAGIIAAAVVVIGLIGGYIFANNYFSRANQLARYVSTYNADNGNIKADLKDYVWADNKKEIKASDLKYLGSLPSKISSDVILAGTSYEKTGSQYWLFPKYKVVVTPQTLNVTGNASGLTFAVQNQRVGQSWTNNFTTSLQHLFPAKYTVTAIGTVSNQKIDLTNTPTLASGSGTADFTLQFISFHLYSNIQNGDVYVGASQIGTLQGGDYKFVNVPVLANEQLRVQKTFSDGIVKSDSSLEVSSITDGASIYLNWGQILDMNAANGLLSNAVSAAGSYAEDKQDPSDLSQIFDGGVSNSWYKNFRDGVDQGLDKDNNKVADSVSFGSPNVTNITQTGVNTYNLTVTVIWNFNFDGNSDSKSPDVQGQDSQTVQYNITVQYEPGSQASSENSNNSQNDSTSNTMSSGSGDDSSNFKITDWDPNTVKNLDSQSNVTSTNNNNDNNSNNNN